MAWWLVALAAWLAVDVIGMPWVVGKRYRYTVKLAIATAVANIVWITVLLVAAGHGVRPL